MTLEEEAWCRDIVEIGCIACIVSMQQYGITGAVHHILDGGRRVSHLETICLCDPGHHQYPARGMIARHPTRARFVAAYGTERELHRLTTVLVEDFRRRNGATLARP